MSSSASIFGNPPLNPPSLNASMIKAIIAGPDEVKAKNINSLEKVYMNLKNNFTN